MKQKSLKLISIGPIAEADVKFGDLTVIVGPQAAGKSVFLQFFKLVLDAGAITRTIKKHGLGWEKGFASFLELYLGEGMDGVWDKRRSGIEYGDKDVDPDLLLRKKKNEESVFFIPAQRVLTLRNGWPRPFSDYASGDPFVVRSFSENIRLLMEAGLGNTGAIFPQEGRFKKSLRDELNDSIFNDAELKLDKSGLQKRLVLALKESNLPFMVWSSGQREFVPLLLGFSWLLPSSKVSRREGVDWVIIEEMEMGLHPRGIFAVMLVVLELLARNYKVVLSTHSTNLVDIVWAMQEIKQAGASYQNILDIFNVHGDNGLKTLAMQVSRKEIRVHYFERTAKGVISQDISRLDPGSDSVQESGWGGLSEYSGRIADIVSSVCREKERRHQ